jgi:Glycosyl transferase family 2
MSTSTISAVVVNHNYAQFVGTAIESVLRQTEPPLQTIVVDDGSSDESARVINSYGNDVLPIFKENGGQASALNKAFSRCTCEWVALLDADDWWLPHKLAAVGTAIAGVERDALLVYHRLVCSNAGAVSGEPFPESLRSGSIAGQVIEAAGAWDFPPTSALCLRRSFLARVTPIPELAFRLCADAYLAILASLLGQIVAVPQTLGIYRVHGRNHWTGAERAERREQTLRRYATAWRTRVEAVNRALDRLEAPGPRLNLSDHADYERVTAELAHHGSFEDG